MALHLGIKKVKRIYLGETPIENIYLGTHRIFGGMKYVDNAVAYIKSIIAGAKEEAKVESIGGRTIVWNQKVQDGTDSWIGFMLTIQNGHITGSGTAVNSGGRIRPLYAPFTAVQNHKYYWKAPLNVDVLISAEGGSQLGNKVRDYSAQNVSGIYNYSHETQSIQYGLNFISGTVYSLDEDFVFIDLTMMFGSGNEPSLVTDPRIAFIEDYLSRYPEYNTCELVSADVTKVVSRGRNLLKLTGRTAKTDSRNPDTKYTDLSENVMYIGMSSNGYLRSQNITEYEVLENKVTVTSADLSAAISYGVGFPVKCSPSTKYYFNCKDFVAYTARVAYYSDDGTWLSTETPRPPTALVLTTPANAGYIVVILGPFAVNESVAITNPIVSAGESSYPYASYREPIEYPIAQAIRSLTLYGVSTRNVYNEVNFSEAQYIQRVGSRAYQSGDESDATVITDGTTTYYPLSTPITTSVTDLLADVSIEAGGTVTFEQTDTKLPIPNTLSYKVDE